VNTYPEIKITNESAPRVADKVTLSGRPLEDGDCLVVSEKDSNISNKKLAALIRNGNIAGIPFMLGEESLLFWVDGIPYTYGADHYELWGQIVHNHSQSRVWKYSADNQLFKLLIMPTTYTHPEAHAAREAVWKTGRGQDFRSVSERALRHADHVILEGFRLQNDYVLLVGPDRADGGARSAVLMSSRGGRVLNRMSFLICPYSPRGPVYVVDGVPYRYRNEVGETLPFVDLYVKQGGWVWDDQTHSFSALSVEETHCAQLKAAWW